jgi:hypothetical protein
MNLEASSYFNFKDYCKFREVDSKDSLAFNSYIATHYRKSYGKECWLEDWDIMWDNFKESFEG